MVRESEGLRPVSRECLGGHPGGRWQAEHWPLYEGSTCSAVGERHDADMVPLSPTAPNSTAADTLSLSEPQHSKIKHFAAVTSDKAHWVNFAVATTY
jgi:hypothetical protein